MRRTLTTLLAVFAITANAQYQPFYVVSIDVQEPDQQFVIDRAFLGNNTYVAFDVYDGGSTSPVSSLAGWDFTLFYGRSQYATSGVSISASSVSSNRVHFLGATNTYFDPYDNYFVSLRGTTGSLTKTFATGRLIVDYDPLAGSPASIVGTTPLNWSLIGPYSGTWPIFAGTNITITSSPTGLTISSSALVGGSGTLTNLVGAGRITASVTGANGYVAFDESGIATNGQWAPDVLSVGIAATNAQVTASNAASGVVAVGLVASNALPASSFSTYAATIGTNAVGGDLTGTMANAQIAAGAVGSSEVDASQVMTQGSPVTGTWSAVGNTNTGGAWVGGGSGNNATGLYAAIGGGTGNEAYGPASFIGGGLQNDARGWWTVVGGGAGNAANSNYAVVAGGAGNIGAGYMATIPGGSGNVVSGSYGTAVGGLNNMAGAYAFAAGVGARALHEGSFVWSSPGDTGVTFASIGSYTFSVRSVGGTYFRSPDFWIQDTNGNTVARFSATNSTISGDLNLTGYATTQALAARIASASGTATNLTAVGLNMSSTRVTRVLGVQLANQPLPVGTNEIASFANTPIYYNAGGTGEVVYTSGTLNIGAYQTVAAYNTALTSTLYRWSGFIRPTTSTNSGQQGQAFTTNGFLYVYDAASNRWGRVALDYAW